MPLPTSEKPSMTIATYIRISTDKQTIDAQRQSLTTYCILKGYKPKYNFTDEGISGATLNRPGFKAMLQAAKEGKISRIITFELSRLSRDFTEGFLVMRELADAGVIVETPNEGVIKMDSVMDQFVVIAKSLVAQQERQKISERTKAGLAAAKARGAVLGAPKGNTNATNKRIHWDEKVILQIKKYRSKGLSHKDISAIINTNHMNIFNLCKREGIA